MFIGLVTAATEPILGDLRPLARIREEGRTEVPPLNQLLEELKRTESRGERQLQYLLWHRGYLVSPRERIIAREVPCSLGGIRRASVADFLVIDDSRRVPVIVEVKCGTASDSLTGALLELLVQWCFHKSAMSPFRRQLRDDGVQIEDAVFQPEAVLVAPASFYQIGRAHV